MLTKEQIDTFIDNRMRRESIMPGTPDAEVMHEGAQEALAIAAQLNGAYRTPEEIRELFSKLIGTNYDVAKFSGINCSKMLIIAYTICSICAAVGGIFFAALRKTASYENGTGYDFSCLTAVLLGGVLLDGGKGSVIGAFGGVLAYGILNNILSWIGLGTYEKYLVQGIVFLFIVWLKTYSNRKLGKT